jgi:hypothetical protein
LDPKTGQASGRKGRWTEVEDSKLKDAVQTHGGKDWGAISALFRVERKHSVAADGMITWIRTATGRVDVRVNRKKTNTGS